MFDNTRPHKDKIKIKDIKKTVIKIGKTVPNGGVNLAYYFNKHTKPSENVIVTEAPRNVLDHITAQQTISKSCLPEKNDDYFDLNYNYEDNYGYEGVLKRTYVDWKDDLHSFSETIKQCRIYSVTKEDDPTQVPETIFHKEGDLEGLLYLVDTIYSPTKWKKVTNPGKIKRVFRRTMEIENLKEPKYDFPETAFEINENGFVGSLKKIQGSEKYIPIVSQAVVTEKTVKVLEGPFEDCINYRDVETGQYIKSRLKNCSNEPTPAKHYGNSRYYGNNGTGGLYGTPDHKYDIGGGKGRFSDRYPAQMMNRYGRFRNPLMTKYSVDVYPSDLQDNRYTALQDETLKSGVEWWQYDVETAAKYGGNPDEKHGGIVWAGTYYANASSYPPYSTDDICNDPNDHPYPNGNDYKKGFFSYEKDGNGNILRNQVFLLPQNIRDGWVPGGSGIRNYYFKDVILFYKGIKIKKIGIYAYDIISAGATTYKATCDYEAAIEKDTDVEKEIVETKVIKDALRIDSYAVWDADYDNPNGGIGMWRASHEHKHVVTQKIVGQYESYYSKEYDAMVTPEKKKDGWEEDSGQIGSNLDYKEPTKTPPGSPKDGDEFMVDRAWYNAKFIKWKDKVEMVPIEWDVACDYQGDIKKEYTDYNGTAHYVGIAIKRNAVGNINPLEDNEIIMYPKNDTRVLYEDFNNEKSSVIEGEQFLLTNIFKDNVPLYYKYTLRGLIYNGAEPSNNIIDSDCTDYEGRYYGSSVKLFNANMKALDSDKYKHICVFESTDKENIYNCVIYTNFISTTYNPIYCIYNKYIDDTNGINIDTGFKEQIFTEEAYKISYEYDILPYSVKDRKNNIKVNTYIKIKDDRKKVEVEYYIKAINIDDPEEEYRTKDFSANVLNRDYAFQNELCDFIDNNNIISPRDKFGMFKTSEELILKYNSIPSFEDKKFVYNVLLKEDGTSNKVNKFDLNLFTQTDGKGYITCETTLETGMFNKYTGNYDLCKRIPSVCRVEGGYILGAFAVKVKDTRAVKVMPPIESDILENWYPRIRFGHFTQLLEQHDIRLRIVYSLPEYNLQNYSSKYNRPYIDTIEKAIYVNEHCIQVPYYPLFIYKTLANTFKNLKVYKITVDDKRRELKVNNYSYSEGYIFLNDIISENDNIYCEYTYEEQGYTYKGFTDKKENFKLLDLNVNQYHYYTAIENDEPHMDIPVYNLFNKTIYFFLRPSSISEEFIDDENELTKEYFDFLVNRTRWFPETREINDSKYKGTVYKDGDSYKISGNLFPPEEKEVTQESKNRYKDKYLIPNSIYYDDLEFEGRLMLSDATHDIIGYEKVKYVIDTKFLVSACIIKVYSRWTGTEWVEHRTDTYYIDDYKNILNEGYEEVSTPDNEDYYKQYDAPKEPGVHQLLETKMVYGAVTIDVYSIWDANYPNPNGGTGMWRRNVDHKDSKGKIGASETKTSKEHEAMLIEVSKNEGWIQVEYPSGTNIESREDMPVPSNPKHGEEYMAYTETYFSEFARYDGSDNSVYLAYEARYTAKFELYGEKDGPPIYSDWLGIYKGIVNKPEIDTRTWRQNYIGVLDKIAPSRPPVDKTINKRTIYHKINDPNPDDKFDLMIGKVLVRHNTSLKSTVLLDSRSRGGGIIENLEDNIRRELEPESDFYLDIGYYDGKQYNDNAVIIIRIDKNILKENGGRFTIDDVNMAINKWIGLGVMPIVEYVNTKENINIKTEIVEDFNNKIDYTPIIF